MNIDKIKEIIVEHTSFFLAEKKLIARELKTDIKTLLELKHVVVVTGIRRCGKSSLLRNIADYLLLNLKINKKNILYINFEDENFINFNVQDMNKILDAYYELNSNSKGTVYLFFDEIQNIPNWERFINRIYETQKFKIFITGSNSHLLSKEISSSLTGRSFSVELYPFSFREYLNYIGYFFNPNESYETQKKAEIKNHFKQYLNNGGFPEFIQNTSVNILGELYQNIIFRDIIVRFSVKNIKEFREFAHYLVSNTAALYSYSSLNKIFPDIKSINTIRKYISYLEFAYLFFNLKKFSPSIKVQARNPQKIYCIDNGMINKVGFNILDIQSKLLENFVYLFFKRQTEADIYYFKEKYEVDFVVKTNKKNYSLYQVCYNIDDPKTKNREETALVEAMNYFNINEGYIVNMDYDKEIKINNKIIKYITAWKL